MKKNILYFLIGAVLFSGLTAIGAAYIYSAKDVSYKNTTVEAAINNLYNTEGNLSSAIENLKPEVLTVTTSGTWAKVMNDVYNAVDKTKLTPRATIVFYFTSDYSFTVHLTQLNQNYFKGATVQHSAGKMYYDEFYFSTASHIYRMVSDSNTVLDIGNEASPVNKVEVYY